MSETNGKQGENENLDVPMEFPTPRSAGRSGSSWARSDTSCGQATEGTSARWQSALTSGMKINKDGGVDGVGRMADAQALLVSQCMFEVLSTGEVCSNPVPVTVVKNWNADVVEKLYQRALKISGLSLERRRARRVRRARRETPGRGRRRNPARPTLGRRPS